MLYNKQYRLKEGDSMTQIRSHIKGIFITLCSLLFAFIFSLLFQYIFDVQEHITTIFVFAVFLVSLFTEGYLYGVLSAFLGTIAVNYAFTFPFFAIDFTTPVNLVSGIVMIAIAVFTSALTTKLKQHEAIKAEGEKERMRANLLRAISHDLRTPLTSIYGSCSVMIENYDDLSKEKQLTLLSDIRGDAKWLNRMVENLLSVTRVDAETVRLSKHSTSLEELIDALLVKFRKHYPRQKVTVKLPEEFITIPMDAMLIVQVLMNFLENAVYHAHGMQNLWLTVETAGKKAVFTVADDGCGISAERLPYLFTGLLDSESPVDSTRNNMGIGLSVCASVIKAHEGNIAVENLKEGGCCFRFTLKMEEEEDEQ